jgi:type II secretory ATPase GspE/PulE/Tfp pilus assembly ATPase PilB-like protein
MSSLPTIWGESLVIRLFEKSGPVMKLEDIGFFPEDLDTIRNLLTRSHGMLLVTGPAGSGKSTTLYSLLREPVFEGKNLITIEDKIEHELSNATQIQIKPHIDLTYAKALRQSLKHDPDVIVVGEIRDPETTRIAVHAALSGHLIIATLQAPTASETLSRLMDMGIEPYLISSSLVGVISQRLVKTICTCPDCRIEDTGAIESLTAAGIRPEHYETITFCKGVGCEACRDGYKGRTIIYELMVIDTPIKRAIVEQRSTKELLAVAKENRMRTMTETALLKAKAGITTAEQIISLSLQDV